MFYFPGVSAQAAHHIECCELLCASGTNRTLVTNIYNAYVKYI